MTFLFLPVRLWLSFPFPESECFKAFILRSCSLCVSTPVTCPRPYLLLQLWCGLSADTFPRPYLLLFYSSGVDCLLMSANFFCLSHVFTYRAHWAFKMQLCPKKSLLTERFPVFSLCESHHHFLWYRGHLGIAYMTQYSLTAHLQFCHQALRFGPLPCLPPSLISPLPPAFCSQLSKKTTRPSNSSCYLTILLSPVSLQSLAGRIHVILLWWR